MARFGHVSTRGRAALLILAIGAGALGTGVIRSVAPAAAASATSVQLTTTTPSVVTGHAAVLKAIVVTGGALPTGSVTFFLDGTQIMPAATGTKNLSGTKNSVAASFTMNTPGAHQFTAKYNGSGVFAASPMSAPVSVNVVQAGTGQATVTISSSLGNTIPSGTPVTLTAHVSGAPVPTGSVSFANGAIGLGANRTLTNGAVSVDLAGLPLGTDTVVASYSGDPTYAPASGSLTITVTATPNDKLLQHMYTDLIGSQDANGEAYWASQMAKGMSRYAVAFGFTQSTQYMMTVISRLYTNEMGRPVDPSGGTFWVNQLRAGWSPERVAASLVASDERFANPSFGNNDLDTYIAAVYQALLGRSEDAAGAAYWKAYMLRGGGRSQMTLDFAAGPEWAGITVTRLYNQFHLGTPDPGGLSYWVGRLLGGLHDDQLAATLVSSQQYYDWAQAN